MVQPITPSERLQSANPVTAPKLKQLLSTPLLNMKTLKDGPFPGKTLPPMNVESSNKYAGIEQKA